MTDTLATPARSRVVIIGGGFGGLSAARALRRAPVDITLIDARNYHLFQPLLYQVATAALSPGDIAYPIRSALSRQKNLRVLLAEAQRIDLEGRVVALDQGELSYDYLVVAAGMTHSYFGHGEWASAAPGLKSVEDALDIRARVLWAYEAAEREGDPAARASWLSFVVVGAGPTGVELAGALAEIGRHTLARDFRAIDPRESRVVLIEGSDRVLPTFPAPLNQKAQRQLERLGVEVLLSRKVERIDSTGVVAGGERIDARTVLWAAGVQGAELGRCFAGRDRLGRVVVEPDLSVPGHPEVFVVGDLAAAKQGDGFVPGLAPAAMQGGRAAARNIRATLEGRPRKAFHYVDKGTLATIGRSKAVGHFRGRWRVAGVFAWVLWWAVHLFFLIGFRNRFIVMFGWVWNWITFQRGARLITGPRPLALPEGQEPNANSGQSDKIAARSAP